MKRSLIRTIENVVIYFQYKFLSACYLLLIYMANIVLSVIFRGSYALFENYVRPFDVLMSF